jgi:hypothetical protein
LLASTLVTERTSITADSHLYPGALRTQQLAEDTFNASLRPTFASDRRFDEVGSHAVRGPA